MPVMWKDLYDHAGPFASVMVDVTTASDLGPDALADLAQAVGQDLDGLGAPTQVVEEVRSRLSAVTQGTGPRSRFVVVTPESVLMDEVLTVETPAPVVQWEALPDPGPLLAVEPTVEPFVLVRAGRDGGDVSASRSGIIAETQTRSTTRELIELVTALVTRGEQFVVVTGHASTCQEVVAGLEGRPARVITLEESERTGPGDLTSLHDDAVDAAEKDLHRREDRLVSQMRERQSSGTAHIGSTAVLRAMATGVRAFVALDLPTLACSHVDRADLDWLDLAMPEGQALRADLAILAAVSRTDAAVLLIEGSLLEHEAVVAVTLQAEQS